MLSYDSHHFRHLTDFAQYEQAKNAYRRVLERDPNHAKVLQQLGWLYHQQNSSFTSQEQAIEYLEKSVNSGRLPFAWRRMSSYPETDWLVSKTDKMHRAGTSWAAVTCRNRSTRKRTKPINRQCIVTAATRRSGARLVSCTTRSTSTAMHLTRIAAQFA